MRQNKTTGNDPAKTLANKAHPEKAGKDAKNTINDQHGQGTRSMLSDGDVETICKCNGERCYHDELRGLRFFESFSAVRHL